MPSFVRFFGRPIELTVTRRPCDFGATIIIEQFSCLKIGATWPCCCATAAADEEEEEEEPKPKEILEAGCFCTWILVDECTLFEVRVTVFVLFSFLLLGFWKVFDLRSQNSFRKTDRFV